MEPLEPLRDVTRPEPRVSDRQRTQLAALVAGGLLLVCATVTTRDWASKRARAAHNLRAHSAAKASIVKTYDSQGHVVRAADFPELPPGVDDLDIFSLDDDNYIVQNHPPDFMYNPDEDEDGDDDIWAKQLPVRKSNRPEPPRRPPRHRRDTC